MFRAIHSSTGPGRSVAVLLVLASRCLAAADAPVDFNRDVRPILADKCFKCHGPDEHAREAELRLDLPDGLFGSKGQITTIVGGQPDASELVRRIESNDPDERMPPAVSNKHLTSGEIRLIRNWIQHGGKWEQHWSFVAPQRPRVPESDVAGWQRNPIDGFVLGRLQAVGLSPSPSAEAITLVRRLYLDLIGLPPTPDEADRWVAALTTVADDGVSTARQDAPATDLGSFNVPQINEAALEELVDHLQDSPHYGERWARRWLDLARYADTNGYEKDRERTIWPYRDWVINAINADMPFDQFTIEQLAGDLLPEATIDQRIATGFHRNTMLNEEGGIDPLEFRFYAMTDRVATTGTTWLGLTVGCAQCHTHKYDPLTHSEYYQLMAFLNNADEPEMDLPDPAVESMHQQNLTEARQLLDNLPSKWPVPAEADTAISNEQSGASKAKSGSVETRFGEWLAAHRRTAIAWTPLRPVTATSNLPTLTILDDASILATGDTTKHDTYTITYAIDSASDLKKQSANPKSVRDEHAAVAPAPETITAVRLEALPDDRLPAHGPGTTYFEGTPGDFFLGEFQLWVDDAPLQFANASQNYAKNRFGANPVSAGLAIDGDLQTGWSVHDRQGERHTAVFVLKSPVNSVGLLRLQMDFGRHFPSSLGRFRISVTSDPGAAAHDQSAEIDQLLLRSDETLSAADRRTLFEEFLMQAPELTEFSKEIRGLRKRPTLPTTLVMRERPVEHPRATFRHHRGEFLQPAEQVDPAVPAFLPSLAADHDQSRLAFAKWLVSNTNPLTARVVVNRHWATFFGKGIVRTVDDFGMQGSPPTHPELLDWLAVEFMESGWSIKYLHKTIVMSATWRQSAQVDPVALRLDPQNRWLGRSPRFRLDAEVIRDGILHAAGLLKHKIGGPPVRPPQPEGVTEAAYGRPTWDSSNGPDRYRRSIYTFIKRTAPFAMYTTFDAPSGEACVARRDQSNTSLQALTLLNDVMIVEAAQALGRHIAEQDGTDIERVRFVFRRIATREPDAMEQGQLLEFMADQRQRIRQSPIDAATLTGSSDQTEHTSELIEQAVWTLLARALFATDEAVTRN